MLLIATAIPAVTSVKNSSINATIPSPPLTSMAGNWTEGQKLLAADGAADDLFGIPVSLSGDTVLIGANQNGDNGYWSGSAYVYTWSGTTWTQQAKLLASDGAAEDQFGFSVSLSGDTALIGAAWDDDNGDNSGSVYVFTRIGTNWTQQAKLLPVDVPAGAQFGISVSLNGDTALIGANRDDNNGVFSGSAYVYTRTGTNWTEQAKLIASDGEAEDRFGYSVSLSGDTALIGSEDGDNGPNSGSAYVFTRAGTTWTFQAKLHASDAAAGDAFGYSVSLSGDTALIGAWFDQDNGVDSGSAYVFTRSGSSWTQQQKLLPSDGAAGDWFSAYHAVALDGDTALIGAWYDDDMGTNSGSAYMFTRTGTTWTQKQKLTASDGAAGDGFGIAVALSGDTAFIGAALDDDNGHDSGSTYVFTKEGGTPDLTFSIAGGVGVKAVIKNNGTTDATDVPWQIHVNGGILGRINKTVNGTIDIPAGETVMVRAVSLGFGAITITAKVADEEKTATGTQLLIFSMVPK
jgi:hypothetical protein